MNNKLSAILTSAVISGLALGGAAFANDAEHHDEAPAKAEKNKCKGHKNECKGHKNECKGKKKKGDKNKCGGKNGCEGKKADEHHEEAAH